MGVDIASMAGLDGDNLVTDITLRPPRGDKLSRVWAWGYGETGALGINLDVLDDRGRVMTPQVVDELGGVYVTQIASGLEHSIIMTSDEELYSCGSGDKGKLGHSDADIFGEGCDHKTQNVCHVTVPYPRLVQSLHPDKRPGVEGNMCAIACGHEYSVAATTNGHLYTWGANEMGQLCHQDRNNKKIPKKVSALREKKIPVDNATCGGNHFMMTTMSASYGTVGKEFGMSIASGLPMASGQGSMGQLGNPDLRDKWVPELLDPKLKSNCEATITSSTMFGGQKVVMMAAGLMHSVILTANGEVWSFGWGVDGQLGQPKPPKDESKPSFMQPRFMLAEPTKIEPLSGVRSIHSGDHFTYAITSAGSVFSWGNNVDGQLGLGNFDAHEQPARCEALSGATPGFKLACGSAHVLALMSDKVVMSWGRGKEGQLGNNDKDSCHTPTAIGALDDCDITSISAGGNCSFAWRNFGAPPAPPKRKAAEAADGPPAKKAKKGKAPAKKKKK